MLLAEDPATLIHHTINNFNIAPDKLAVARIHESISTLQQARDLRLRECESSLKKLSRTLHTLQSQHEELVSTHSSTAHASAIARLDTNKFRTAKAASDAEMESERLAQQAADLAARLQELELQGVDGYLSSPADGEHNNHGANASTVRRARDSVEDEVLLRLKVYRSLGIDLERDEKDGEFVKAVVRSERKGDVHVVNMDKKFSPFFYANYFWQTL